MKSQYTSLDVFFPLFRDQLGWNNFICSFHFYSFHKNQRNARPYSTRLTLYLEIAYTTTQFHFRECLPKDWAKDWYSLRVINEEERVLRRVLRRVFVAPLRGGGKSMGLKVSH